MQTIIDSPNELLDKLINFHPALKDELDEDDDIGLGYKQELTYHQIWQSFAPMAESCLTKLSKRDLSAFCNLINLMVSDGGEKENAVSTCFLEHASQIEVKKLLKPHLSKEACNELR